MNPVDMNSLLDLDELNEDQQEYIKGLITYEINPKDTYALTFTVKNKKWGHNRFGYTLKESDLDKSCYKYIMFRLIERNSPEIKDPKIIKKVQGYLSSVNTEHNVDHRTIGFGNFIGKVFIMENEQQVKSQNLLKAVQLIMGAR